jgi:hypothetical protein
MLNLIQFKETSIRKKKCVPRVVRKLCPNFKSDLPLCKINTEGNKYKFALRRSRNKNVSSGNQIVDCFTSSGHTLQSIWEEDGDIFWRPQGHLPYYRFSLDFAFYLQTNVVMLSIHLFLKRERALKHWLLICVKLSRVGEARQSNIEKSG